MTTCGLFRPEWARLTSLVPRQRDQEVSRARTQNSGGDTVAAAVGAGVCRWEVGAAAGARHCQLEQSEGDFRRFASAIHQVACDV